MRLCHLTALAFLPALFASAALSQSTTRSQSGVAQQGGANTGLVAGKAPLPSPDATASVTLDGKAITIKYNAPSVRGRKIMGGLVPYGEVWRTGANPATTFTTAAHLKVGTLDVPAGTYTLYTLPAQDTWMLIINRQTGQWGLTYDQAKDLGRTPMIANPLSNKQEVMSISFDNKKKNSAELHIKWETTDRYVTVTAE